MTQREQIRQAAWIHGLPGEERPLGIPVQVVGFKPPQGQVDHVNVTLETTSDVITKLKDLASNKTAIPRLGLVVREPNSQMDHLYQMVDARILSVQSERGAREAANVSIKFGGLQVTTQQALN